MHVEMLRATSLPRIRTMRLDEIVNEIEILVCHVHLIPVKQLVHLDQIQPATCLDMPHVGELGGACTL